MSETPNETQSDGAGAAGRLAAASSTAPERLAEIIPGIIIEHQARALRHYANATRRFLEERPSKSEGLSHDLTSSMAMASAYASAASDLREAWERAAR